MEERLEKVVKKGPLPDYTLRWRFVASSEITEIVEDEVLVEIGWEADEDKLENTEAPFANETVVQFHIQVTCLPDPVKPGALGDIYWHGLLWDGVQSKPTKPK